MKARKTGFIALAVALAAAAVTLVITAAPSAGPVRKHQPQATLKAAWIYVGPHNDGGWSQAHDKGRLFAQKALGSAVRDDIQGERPGGTADLSGDREPRARRQQDHLRDLLRVPGLHGLGGQEVSGCLLRAGDRDHAAQEPAPVLRGGRGLDLPLRHGGRRRHQEGHDRLRRPVPDPRGDPARKRLRARCASHPSRGQGEADLDPQLVRAGQGAQGRREPQGGRFRRARAKRRQPRCGPVRGVEGRSVGRVRLRRAQVRSEAVAHRRDLQLGPVLPDGASRQRRTGPGRRASTTGR